MLFTLFSFAWYHLVTTLLHGKFKKILWSSLLLGSIVSFSSLLQHAEKLRLRPKFLHSLFFWLFSHKRYQSFLTPIFFYFHKAITLFSFPPFEQCLLLTRKFSCFFSALRNWSSTARAEFPSANSVLDGFGGADLTISRLRKTLWT